MIALSNYVHTQQNECCLLWCHI